MILNELPDNLDAAIMDQKTLRILEIEKSKLDMLHGKRCVFPFSSYSTRFIKTFWSH